jgi:hypothetical protein
MNRLREENKSMSDSLRRLRQMKISLEKDKNLAESEIISLRVENRAMSLRIKELEETILNDRLKRLKGVSTAKTQQINRAEVHDHLFCNFFVLYESNLTNRVHPISQIYLCPMVAV